MRNTCQCNLQSSPKGKRLCPQCGKPRKLQGRRDATSGNGTVKRVGGERKRVERRTARGDWSSDSSGNLRRGTRSLLDSSLRRALQEALTEQYAREQRLVQAIAELKEKIPSGPQMLLPGKNSRVTMNGLGTDIMRGQLPLQPSDAEADLLAEAFGAVSIHDDRKTQFHGPTATSEYLLQECDELANRDCDPLRNSPALPKDRSLPRLDIYPELVLVNLLFPCPPPDQLEPSPDMKRFLPFLPSHERAVTLLDNYLSYFCWLAIPIPLPDLHQTFALLYPVGERMHSLDVFDAHRVAVLFAVFLIGTLYDLDLDDQTRRANMDVFLALTRAAVSSYPVAENTTLPGLQTMIIIIWYHRLCPGKRSLSFQWCLSGYMTKLVQAIGLHRDGRDSSKYVQDPIEIGRCEQTFWEYNFSDIWQSYMCGRPTSMTSASVQCRRPSTIDVHTGHFHEFYLWKYSFAGLVSDVVGATTAKEVTYENILEYGKNFRKHCTPVGLEWPRRGDPLPTNEVVGRVFQRCLTSVLKQVAIMYIHRPYFWEAISKNTEYPIRHPCWRSIVAAYHSATSLVSDVRRLWLAYPRLVERMAPFWSHAHSAALVLGALVALSPGCQFAQDALRDFDETCDMFFAAEDILKQPFNRKSAMVKLQRRAHWAFERIHNQAEDEPESGNLVYVSPPENSPLTSSSSSSPHSTSASPPPLSLPMPQVCDIQLEYPVVTSLGSDTGMPAEYEVYRQQESGWDHLFSRLGDYPYN